MPGLIGHATNYVEHPELIADYIVKYAGLVGRENVIASADCGFSSRASYAPEVHPTVVWPKFRALADGAALATKQLWGLAQEVWERSSYTHRPLLGSRGEGPLQGAGPRATWAASASGPIAGDRTPDRSRSRPRSVRVLALVRVRGSPAHPGTRRRDLAECRFVDGEAGWSGPR